MTHSAIVQIRGLKKYYGRQPNIVKALDGIDLDIDEGSLTAIVGASGSGKSTLLHMIGGLDTPTEGTVTIAGRELCRLDRRQATIYRRRNIGIVFQNYNLIPMLNVYENIIFPIAIDGNKPDSKYISEITSLLKLDDKLERNVAHLSGGQQQRVAIARALAVKPSILLCGRTDRKPRYTHKHGCHRTFKIICHALSPDDCSDHSQRRNRSNGRPYYTH